MPALYSVGKNLEFNNKSKHGFSGTKKRTNPNRLNGSDLFDVAPQVGLEPTTLRLTAACSTDVTNLHLNINTASAL